MEEINEFKHEFFAKINKLGVPLARITQEKKIKNTQLPKSAIKRTHYKPTKKEC